MFLPLLAQQGQKITTTHRVNKQIYDVNRESIIAFQSYKNISTIIRKHNYSIKHHKTSYQRHINKIKHNQKGQSDNKSKHLKHN